MLHRLGSPPHAQPPPITGSDDDSLDEALNTLCPRRVSVLPHDPHAIGASASRIARSASVVFPHFSHTYS